MVSDVVDAPRSRWDHFALVRRCAGPARPARGVAGKLDELELAVAIGLSWSRSREMSMSLAAFVALGLAGDRPQTRNRLLSVNGD